MISHPRTEELAESVRLWIDEIRPTLDPRNAFLARVAANAMATIARELTVESPGLMLALQTMAKNQIAIDQPSYKPEGTPPA